MNRALLGLELEAYLWLAPCWKGNCSGVARSANCRSRPARRKKLQKKKKTATTSAMKIKLDGTLEKWLTTSSMNVTFIFIIVASDPIFHTTVHHSSRVSKLPMLKSVSWNWDNSNCIRISRETIPPPPEGTSVRWYAAAATARAMSDSRAQRASGTGNTEGVPLLPKIHLDQQNPAARDGLEPPKIQWIGYRYDIHT